MSHVCLEFPVSRHDVNRARGEWGYIYIYIYTYPQDQDPPQDPHVKQMLSVAL